ncbi:glycosyltransferase [Halorientalis pallida]|uniref:glycosyltransferase n=1 Tax=Halorientalis pallida TaxID=2479928 RepID=UPI003C70224E
MPLQLPVVSPNPAITFLALLFGAIWTLANFYAFYPLVQSGVEVLVERLRGPPADPEGDPDPLSDGGRPTVDVLLAAYDEADVIEQAITSVLDAEYPDTHRTLTVLLEPGDDPTRAVVDRLRESYAFDVLTVPASYPGDPNKPRALNYGFEHTDGDIVGVVDAEDIVADGLLEEVATAVMGGADFAQGRLDMANEDDGWLNLLFRAEYGYWYNVVTPAFARVDYPIPMAGTTCFFRRSVLETASKKRLAQRGDPWTDDEWAWIDAHGLAGVRPWDPRNVTEDFELGLFLWELDYDFTYLDSVTTEESPPTLAGWLDQRTRWKKGKVYTLLDRREHPPADRRDRAHVYWQSLLPHLGPLNVAGLVVLFLIANLATYRPSTLVGAVLSLGGAFAVVTSVLFAVGYWTASDAPLPTRLRRALLSTVTLPLYWFVQWGADIRALVRVYGGDLQWEHTEHFGRGAIDADGHDPDALGRRTGRLTLPRYQRLLALAGVLVVAGILRVFVLGGWSLWTDEIYSVAVRGALPVADLLVLPNDPHPPLYYLLLHWWMDAFGTGRVAVRSLSVLAGVGATAGVYLLGTELFDDRTGLLAAALVAVSAFHVHFSRVARMYAIFTMLTALSWYYYARLRDGTRTSAVGYVLASTLLVYTHVYGLFVVLAQHAYTALSEVDGGIGRRRWVRVSAALGLLSAPWAALLGLRVVAIVTGTGGANIEWIPEPSSVLLTQTAISFVGFPDFYPLTAGTVGLYVLAAVVLFVYVGQLLASVVRVGPDGLTLEDPSSVGQLAALLFVPTLVPIIVSLVVPIYVPRYAAPASVAFVVLAARGLRNVPVRRVRAGLLAVVLVSSLVFIGVYYTADSAEPWAQVAGTITANADTDDVVVHQPGNMGGYERQYYDDAEFATATLSQAGRLGVDDLQYLRDLSTRHGTVYLVQYYGSRDAAVRYLDACHDGSNSNRLGVITVREYSRDTGCPDPAAFLDGGQAAS